MVSSSEPPALWGGPGDLGESLELWRSVVEAVPDVLLLVREDGTILYGNPAARTATPEAVPGTPVLQLVPEAVQAELRQSLSEIFSGAPPRVRELPATHSDGVTRWYATHTGPVRLRGKVVAATIVARDVTDQRRTEIALRESEERYRTLVEHAPEAIVVLDADACRFVEANRNACVLFGMSRDALLTSDPVALSPPTQPDGRPSDSAAWDHIRAALDGDTPAFEWQHRTPAGVDLRCEVRLVRLPGGGRRLVRGSVTDVSRQRQLEDHVRQWQKMEALGQLAGGIAHDFNNVLQVIAASAELVAEELPASEGVRLEAEWIREAARRGTGLTKQLLAFARPREARRDRVDLNAVVTEGLGLWGRLLGPGVKLVTRLAPSGAPVRADRSQLDQILMNFVVNARDAMPSGGTVTITTSRLPERKWPEGATCVVRGPVVTLRIEDTGVGMDDVTRRSVFEPFFTTKAEGRGSGLGLAIVYGLIKRYGGCVEVSSHPGKGSAFEVILPDPDRSSLGA